MRNAYEKGGFGAPLGLDGVLVPGTPEQVWQAVADQPKSSSRPRGLLEGERIAN
jgi:hypothetical protein